LLEVQRDFFNNKKTKKIVIRIKGKSFKGKETTGKQIKEKNSKKK